MKLEYVAYKGLKFTIEWYFNIEGHSKVKEYFESLTKKEKQKIFNLFKLIDHETYIFNKEKFRYEGKHIYALKSSKYRFFCFFYKDSKIIVTNGYKKKAEKVFWTEKVKALKNRKDYLERMKEGIYYDQEIKK